MTYDPYSRRPHRQARPWGGARRGPHRTFELLIWTIAVCGLVLGACVVFIPTEQLPAATFTQPLEPAMRALNEATAQIPRTDRPSSPPLQLEAPAPVAAEVQDTGSSAALAEPQREPARPLWVRTSAAAQLLSAAGKDARVFTELPPGSLLRVQGPTEKGRVPVFYFGDGLLRSAGGAWIDETLVGSVDPPAPGEEPRVDAAAMRPLPNWVQGHGASTLWSGPDGQAVPLTDLPQWSYLRVVGAARGGRLLVEYSGDHATRLAGVGWVDEASVGPAGDPGRWLQNHRQTHLYSGPDEDAAQFTDLPQWSKVRVIEGEAPRADRVLVEFFGDGRTRLPGTAWVPITDLGPVTPPAPLPVKLMQASSLAGSPLGSPLGEARVFRSQSEFINTIGDAARKDRARSGVPASVTVAQAILESDWGRSRLTRQGNNLFGIKALIAPGTAGTITLSTWEHVGGEDIVVQAPFKAYASLDDSIEDHGRFFRGRNYREAMKVAKDAQAFARAIHAAGYATDPDYSNKLIRLMDRYDLYRFDPR